MYVAFYLYIYIYTHIYLQHVKKCLLSQMLHIYIYMLQLKRALRLFTECIDFFSNGAKKNDLLFL